MIRTLTVVFSAALVAAACSGSDGNQTVADGAGDGQQTTVTTQTAAPASTTETSEAAVAQPDTDTPQGNVIGVEPDAEWERLDEGWFVYGVADDDVLNVRSSPGIDNDVLATLPPDEASVSRFGEVVFVGETRWSPIVVSESPAVTVGWVNLAFLRPEPSVSPPVVEGLPIVEDAVLASVVASLGSPSELAVHIGDGGVLLAPQQFLDDSTQRVARSELTDSPNQVRVWGTEDGEGGEIESSIGEFLTAIAGSAAITSTEAIGFDTTISSGNLINNIATTFPDARVVEYYFGGTTFFGGLDWESVTFVFDDTDKLLAIALGAWTV